jgi:hypothetical protein
MKAIEDFEVGREYFVRTFFQHPADRSPVFSLAFAILRSALVFVISRSPEFILSATKDLVFAFVCCPRGALGFARR